MINPPKTLAQARKLVYGAWKAGGRAGTPYREGYCAMEVAESGRAINFYQCQRKLVKGTIWCRQHNPKAIKARREASTERYHKQLANSPYVRADKYARALRKIIRMAPASAFAEVARKALKS